MKGVAIAGGAAAVVLAYAAAGGLGRVQGAPAPQKPPEVKLFEFLDADGDGKVSGKEYDKAFSRLDADGDGALTQDEILKIFKAEPAKKGGARKKKPDPPADEKPPAQ